MIRARFISDSGRITNIVSKDNRRLTYREVQQSGGGGETKNDERMTKDESTWSTAGEDSSGGATVDWLRLEEL